jgi:hypothetical protein
MSNQKQVLGRLERVWFPEFGPQPDGVIAKIDTGAESGAVHCVFERVVQDDKGVDVLEYQPLDSTRPVIRTYDFERVAVTSSHGVKRERHIIQTKISIRGQDYDLSIGLTDRRKMKYDVIIGYKFLKGRFLVDVAQENV